MLRSYILRYDIGSAPNPFWGVCTLAICKPAIRRTAGIGDWVIGTGSKNSKLKDGETHNLAGRLVYAMKITDKKTLEEYDEFCRKSLKQKVPKWASRDYKKRVGDCIYEYSEGSDPKLRESVHKEENRKTDLGGENVLLSTEFYYFGENPIEIPQEFKEEGIVRDSQGYKKIPDTKLTEEFESWIRGNFEKNKLYAEPQLKYEISDK